MCCRRSAAFVRGGPAQRRTDAVLGVWWALQDLNLQPTDYECGVSRAVEWRPLPAFFCCQRFGKCPVPCRTCESHSISSGLFAKCLQLKARFLRGPTSHCEAQIDAYKTAPARSPRCAGARGGVPLRRSQRAVFRFCGWRNCERIGRLASGLRSPLTYNLTGLLENGAESERPIRRSVRQTRGA